MKRFPDKKQSTEQGRIALKMMLASARSIDAFTPVALAGMYPVSIRECEAMLSAARDVRRRECEKVLILAKAAQKICR